MYFLRQLLWWGDFWSRLSLFHSSWMRKTSDHPPSGTFLIHESSNLHIIAVYQIVCIFCDKAIGEFI